MKKFLLTCLTTLFALTTWAYDFEVDGYYYNILEDQENAVEVTYASDNKTTACTFNGDVIIPETVDYKGTTYTVVGIGEYAFYCGYFVTAIELPSTLTYIGDYAFTYCWSTQMNPTLIIPDLVTTIGDHAFEIVNLSYLTIGKSVSYIGDKGLFVSGQNIVVYSLNPEPPTCYDDESIPSSSFDNGTLYVPEGSGSIYGETYPWCWFYQILEFGITPPTVTTLEATDIGKTTVTLKATVEKGTDDFLDQGFEYWSSSTNPQICKAEISGEEMTASVENLSAATNYTYRAYVTTKGGTFYGEELGFVTMNDYDYCVDGYYYKIVSSSAKTCAITSLYPASDMNSTAYTGDIEIPSTVDLGGTTYTVVNIDSYTFDYCSGVTSVVIPETVTYIGTSAFYYCTSLKEMDIPSSVTSIGNYLFGYCTSLEKVTIPNSISTIRVGFCYQCTSLKSIDIPDTVTSLEAYVFYHCSNLEKAMLSHSIKTLDDYSFYYCSSLESIEIPDNVTSIGRAVFSHCTSLEEVILSNSITSIGQSAFSSCAFSEITLPETLTTISTQAFYDCDNLVSIYIPDNITSMGNQVFAYCDGLKTIKIGNGITELDAYTFYMDPALEEIIWGENLVTIGTGVFGCDSSLKTVKVPEGVKTMGNGVFSNCTSLVEATLPSTLTEIGTGAFYWCLSLAKVYSYNPEPPVCAILSDGRGVFADVDLDACTLYVPVGSYDAYRTADQWEDFMNVIEMVGVETLDAGDVTASSAVLNGKITTGDYTLDVTKEGFEFWKEGLDNVITTIGIEESDMSYNITNLDPETTYIYRAFATTEDGTTYYGDDVLFTTAEDTSTGIDNVGMSGINGENVEGIYSTSGQKLNTTVKGVNIIRYTDGTVKKIYVK